MPRFRSSPRLIPLLLALSLVACKRGRDPGGGGTPGDTAAASAGGLSAADREAFYHLAEGSEIGPLNMVRALRSRATGKLFFEDPERFGLIADPANPDGLPVGVTGDYTVDTRFLNTRMVGFNCAACHVNEVTWRGNRVRLDGAPSRFYPDSLKDELLADGRYTLTHPRAAWQYLKDLRAIERARPPAVAAREPAQLTAADAARTDALFAQLSDADTTEAEREFTAEVERALAEDSARSPAVNLLDVPWDSAAPAHRVLRERYHPRSAREVAAMVLRRLRPRTREELRFVGEDPQNASHTEVVAAWVVALRLLRDRIATLGAILHHERGLAHTADGVGRVDAFGVARNKIYTHNQVPTTASVSFPFLWGFADQHWLHYDANTNSVMERNLGQALGVGAVWDRRTLQSTLNPRNIYQLEQIARRIPAPAWPAAFPAIDRARADSGKATFGRECAGCHQDRPTGDMCFPLAATGTDSLRATNFALPLGAGTFTDSVGPVLLGLKRQAYATFHVPADSQTIMDGIPDARVVWRTTRMWGARPLSGIWATAPFLHNGSVPSLYELLLPPERRSKRFPLGHTEYDPARVGYTTTGPGVWTFDTSQPGNGNGGHAYGTQLAEPERLALLEYLKTLGAYGEAPPSGGVPCPSLAR